MRCMVLILVARFGPVVAAVVGVQRIIAHALAEATCAALVARKVVFELIVACVAVAAAVCGLWDSTTWLLDEGIDRASHDVELLLVCFMASSSIFAGLLILLARNSCAWAGLFLPACLLTTLRWASFKLSTTCHVHFTHPHYLAGNDKFSSENRTDKPPSEHAKKESRVPLIVCQTIDPESIHWHRRSAAKGRDIRRDLW